MTSDAIRDEGAFSASVPRFEVREGVYEVARRSGYLIIFIFYIFIAGLAVLTLGMIEIRQANLTEFNGLIATLDQRDWYSANYFDTILNGIASDRHKYQSLTNTLSCSDQAGGSQVRDKPPIQTSDEVTNTDANKKHSQSKTCAEIREIVSNHVNALSMLQDDVLFRKANLSEYYDSYRDGIRDKAPQLIPVLGLLDSGSRVVTLWARMPFELLEMLLLICMGALGGVISVTRCFVDPTISNPLIRDLCYRPVAGGVIALGIYILFRAGQLFFGGPSQNAGATLTTSIFVLAALGLASGFCAREAVAQIEFAATRILRRAEGGRDDYGSGEGTGSRSAEKSEAPGADRQTAS